MSEIYDMQISKVESCVFGKEDHGILTLMIRFTGGSWGQSMPGYSLGAHCGEFVEAVLEAFGAWTLNEIKGMTVYTLRAAGDPYGPIVGIENLPTEKGHRLVFSEFWETIKKKEGN